MIKLTQLIHELGINTGEIIPNKWNFIKFIKNYYHLLNEIDSILLERYETKNFENLSDIIIKKFKPIKKYWDAFNNSYEDFSQWIKGIDNEDKGYKSSGSFYTSLYDTDPIYDGVNYGLTEEECENLAVNCMKY